MAWNMVCWPVCYGGLSVKNIRLQALALSVRWEWLRRSDPERSWQGLSVMVGGDARNFFDSLDQISVGGRAERAILERSVDIYAASLSMTLLQLFLQWTRLEN